MTDDKDCTVAPQEPVFPLEILRLIIENAILGSSASPKSRRHALRGLICTSTVLAQICSEYVYRDVEIWEEHDKFPPRHRQFMKAVQAYPSITASVHHLVFLQKKKAWKGGFSRQISDARKVASWMDNMDVYLEFANLRSLTVKALPIGDHRPSFDVYQKNPPKPLYQRIIDRYLDFGCLTTLHVENVTLLPIIRMLLLPNLYKLVLVDCEELSYDWQEKDDLPAGYIFKLKDFRYTGTILDSRITFLLAHCLELRYATIGDRATASPRIQVDPAFMPPSFTSLSFQNLVTLECSGWSRWVELTRASGVLGQSFPRLRSLKLYLEHEDEVIQDHFPLLHHLHGLKTLEIKTGQLLSWALHPEQIPNLSMWGNSLKSVTISWCTGRDAASDFVSRICDMLKPISGSNVLERLKIEFVLQIQNFESPFDNSEVEGWQRLRSILGDDGRNNFPLLKEVGIRVEVDFWEEMNMRSFKVKEYVDMLDKALLGWRSNPGISVKYHVAYN